VTSAAALFVFIALGWMRIKWWYVRLKLTIVRAPTATPPAMADESSTRGSVSECVHDHISLADVLNGEPQQLLAVNVSWLAQALADPSPGSTVTHSTWRPALCAISWRRMDSSRLE